jgi:hypothetical protein
MPVEADLSRNEQPPNVVGRVFVESASQSLESSLCKIEHCLAQLDEADVQWRQHESHNSIQNIILHLCGNLRQWILHGVGGAPDKRNRPLEFSDHRPLTKDHLAGELRSAVSGLRRFRAGGDLRFGQPFRRAHAPDRVHHEAEAGGRVPVSMVSRQCGTGGGGGLTVKPVRPQRCSRVQFAPSAQSARGEQLRGPMCRDFSQAISPLENADFRSGKRRIR